MRTVNFILIKNLCTVDLIGALVILPMPLMATAITRFNFRDTMCTANAVNNMALGFLHIVINKISFFFQLKMRTVNFILIKNLCTVDLIGALVILPIPLVATAKGRFDFGDTVCTANAIINVAIWFQHIVMFAMLKVNFSSGHQY
jgi:hypothetical protein